MQRNAGLGVFGYAIERDRAEQLNIIAVNIRALEISRCALANQLIRNRGGILNVGSIAGFVPGPGMAVYYASKALPMYDIARDALKDPNYWADEPIEEDE